MKDLITNPFFLAGVCFLGGAIFTSWLWFGLFELGDFWSSGGITKEGKIGLLIGFICGGIAFARGWAFCRWH